MREIQIKGIGIEVVALKYRIRDARRRQLDLRLPDIRQRNRDPQQRRRRSVVVVFFDIG